MTGTKKEQQPKVLIFPGVDNLILANKKTTFLPSPISH